MNADGRDPAIIVEQIDLSFRVLDDMERFLVDRHLPGPGNPPPDRAERIVVAQIQPEPSAVAC